jgi:hypothetical protein
MKFAARKRMVEDRTRPTGGPLSPQERERLQTRATRLRLKFSLTLVSFPPGPCGQPPFRPFLLTTSPLGALDKSQKGRCSDREHSSERFHASFGFPDFASSLAFDLSARTRPLMSKGALVVPSEDYSHRPPCSRASVSDGRKDRSRTEEQKIKL